MMICQVIGTTLIGLSWGIFDHTRACGYLLATCIWTFFILSTLFDFVPPKKEETNENSTIR